ncbi:histone deacetylase [Limibacter armeniacum]|uniref:histone deacetylase family protein n=1 Tax=Limibacter armeniacum TaxID=466084 RepID=UPI002FE5445A
MLKIAYSPVYVHELPEGHRFPMLKYELLVEQLMYEGIITEKHLFEPHPVDERYILETHDAIYWDRLKKLSLDRKEVRRIGFPLSDELVHREMVINQGSIMCAEFAMEYGVAMNIAGGTHHAFADCGEGFCLLNDIAMAANYLINHRGINQVLVVDLDVHQGNGTASIFQGNDKVYTFSMHGAHNFPLRKEMSDLDIGLPDGTTDQPYLDLLAHHLNELLDTQKPEIVFFQSGVDVLHTDKLGRLAMTIQGCKERDRLVLEACHKRGIPVCVSMGGGYSAQIRDIVNAHANTFKLAESIYA